LTRESDTRHSISETGQTKHIIFFCFFAGAELGVDNFSSKEEILLSMRASADEGIAPAMRRVPPGGRPVDAARAALAAVCAQYRTEELRVVDQLMRASETVQARKQTFYIAREKSLLAALRERWPEPEQEASLQLVAMVSVAAFRHALDMFNLEAGKRSLTTLLEEAFDRIERQFQSR